MWALVKRWEKRFSHQKTFFFFELLCRIQQHWHWQQKLLPTRRTFKSSHVRMETSFLAFEIETVLTYQTSMQRDSWVIWVCIRRKRRGKSANFQIASAFVPIDFLKLFKKQTMSVPRQVVSELPNRRQSCSTTAQLIKKLIQLITRWCCLPAAAARQAAKAYKCKFKSSQATAAANILIKCRKIRSHAIQSSHCDGLFSLVRLKFTFCAHKQSLRQNLI